MICFDVSVNGERLCTAGVGDDGILNAIVNWVGNASDLHLAVGGLYAGTDTHPRWVDHRDLKTGDEVIIKVVELPHPDPPTSQTTYTSSDLREAQRRYYEELKQRFEGEPE